MSVYDETSDVLPGLLYSADHDIDPVPPLKGSSYITSGGVPLYEADLDGKELILVFGHLPFSEMIEAVCAFLNAEGPTEDEEFDPGNFDHQHAIVSDLTYRRILLPEELEVFDMTKIGWSGGYVPVTVWMR